MILIFKPLQNLYEWTLDLGQKPYALIALALLAFAESIFFPLPLEILLVPLILGARERVWLVVLIAALFSALGAVGGFYVGQTLQETIYHIPGLSPERVEPLENSIRHGGVWIIATGALTFVPFKVTTIAAGLFHYPSVGLLFLWSFLFRGIRYAIIGVLLYAFGDQAKKIIDHWFGWLCLLAIVLLAAVVWYLTNH